jgi:hypothetical protein
MALFVKYVQDATLELTQLLLLQLLHLIYECWKK